MNGAGGDCTISQTGVLCGRGVPRLLRKAPLGASRALELDGRGAGKVIGWLEEGAGWTYATWSELLIRHTGGLEAAETDVRVFLESRSPELLAEVRVVPRRIRAPDGAGEWHLVSLPRNAEGELSAAHLALEWQAEISSAGGAKEPGVTHAEPRFLVVAPGGFPTTRASDRTWPLRRVGAAGFRPGERKVRIAVFDTGSYAVGALEAFLVPRGEDYEAYNFLPGSTSPWHGGHGWNCTSLIGQVLAAAAGAKGRVAIVPYRVLNPHTCGPADVLARALLHAAANRIDVVSASWILRGESQCLLDAVQLTRERLNLVTGAPNDPVDLDKCPNAQVLAHKPLGNVLVVGAIDRDGGWHGAVGRSTIDMTAPGHGVYVESLEHDAYGTSYATAIAAATLGLSLTRQTDSIDPCQIRAEFEADGCPVDGLDIRCRTGRIVALG